MNLIERWRDFTHQQIMDDMCRILDNHPTWDTDLFCVDENGQQIRYCGDNTDVETYGRKAGICFSEDDARKCIKSVLIDYTFLLIPWMYNDSEEVDLCIKVNFPMGYSEANGEIKEFVDVILKFRKCNNKAGLCIAKVIPVKWGG